MKYLKYILSIAIFNMFIYGSIAQLKDKDYYIGMMDSGVKLMEIGNYKEADEKFKIVLRNVEVLPSEISFYFGQNSYLLGEYKQSINWLNKYIELKGTKGQFFEECVEYLEKSEKAYLLQSEIEKGNILTELSQHNEFDCKGRQFFQCPICKGEGVLIEPGKMNNVIYKTCPYCVGEGRITCDDYKLFLKGNLKSKE